jgi:hypothetical protein
VAGAALVLFAAVASAQLPTFANVQTQLQADVTPLVQIIRFSLMAVCIIMAAVQFFSAARGQARGYLNGMVLLLVAGFSAAPASWINLLGLTDVATNMASWGF